MSTTERCGVLSPPRLIQAIQWGPRDSAWIWYEALVVVVIIKGDKVPDLGRFREKSMLPAGFSLRAGGANT